MSPDSKDEKPKEEPIGDVKPPSDNKEVCPNPEWDIREYLKKYL